MTIEEAREYWSKRLEHAEAFSDEYMSAYMSEKERRIQADYIDALKHAVAALAICREREEAAKKPKTNGDCIRNMTDDEELLIEIGIGCYRCAYINGECDRVYGKRCIDGNLEWLKQEVSEDGND